MLKFVKCGCGKLSGLPHGDLRDDRRVLFDEITSVTIGRYLIKHAIDPVDSEIRRLEKEMKTSGLPSISQSKTEREEILEARALVTAQRTAALSEIKFKARKAELGRERKKSA